jgi:predicted nuclease of restriction endonuclease-like (RecB) superfamily
MAKSDNTAYKDLLEEIINQLEHHRIQAASQLNSTLMQLYFSIGAIIVNRQQKEGWGKSIVERLALDLSKTTSSPVGFSAQNLWYMRQFYLEYKEAPELQQLAFQVPWGQNIVIFSRTKNEQERAYYLLRTKEAGWTRKTLLNQIKAEAFQRQQILTKTHNFSKALPVHLSEQAREVLKSEYNLEFLGIGEPVLERKLENKLLEHLKGFILELGYGFAFIGSQYQLSLREKEYFVDLLFFHRKLKCLIAIDLLCCAQHNKSYVAKLVMCC